MDDGFNSVDIQPERQLSYANVGITAAEKIASAAISGHVCSHIQRGP